MFIAHLTWWTVVFSLTLVVVVRLRGGMEVILCWWIFVTILTNHFWPLTSFYCNSVHSYIPVGRTRYKEDIYIIYNLKPWEVVVGPKVVTYYFSSQQKCSLNNNIKICIYVDTKISDVQLLRRCNTIVIDNHMQQFN